ncbi:BTAD domain-containing putative transcriptional regulator [Streptomyces brasiliscabiei]|uniref:BTAD domain-containing putative transcriptional regulator n=1 Tax=Streptomyces brasiliscabiei TaxID=2736302 RepID=A0ABU8GV92_9ACTN
MPARHLVDGLYGTEPPAGATNALRSRISRPRGRPRPHTEIEITSAGDHPQAAARLREAFALWRGPALPDLPDAYAEGARLDGLRLAAVQDRIEADLVLGGGPEPVPEVADSAPTRRPTSPRSTWNCCGARPRHRAAPGYRPSSPASSAAAPNSPASPPS